MDRDLDRIAADLQARIDDQVLEDFGAQVYARWKNPPCMGRMEDYHAMAAKSGSCGNRVEIYLRLEKNRIAGASFFSEGCGSSAVCASVLCGLVKGLDPGQALDLTAHHVMQALPELPPGKKRYAELAVQTLHQAVQALEEKKADKDKGKSPER